MAHLNNRLSGPIKARPGLERAVPPIVLERGASSAPNQIPYYSLGAELTDDYVERTRVISVREGLGLVGLLAATIVPAYLINLYGGRRGYGAMGAILGGATALFLFVSGAVATERPEFQGRPSMNPYAGIVATLRNRPFF